MLKKSTLLLALAFATSLQAEQTLEQRFENPPESAQPGVYWYFNDGVYTQTTDVEGEINGLVTYDRAVIKTPAAKLAELHRRLGAEITR